jgi:tRNA (guanine37-N1)-methyltransferase
MVMKPGPIYRALKSVGVAGSKKTKWPKSGPIVLYMSPQGEKLSQSVVKKLAGYDRLVVLCGHYEGVDGRVLSWVNNEISIGDYVLTGGELPAMVVLDAVSRFIPGVVKEKSSVERDSFFSGLLDYPSYTRPSDFMGARVPEVLLSGDHEKIEKWRKQQAISSTKKKRPDLLLK